MEVAQFDPKVYELEVLSFWKEHRCYPKAKEKVRGAKKFYFLDGPPYTSGRIHIGHAWNKSLKDLFIRYKRMQGFDVWDRAGFDMHGIPTEHAVEKKLGLKGKPDILKFGVDKYVKECEKLCIDNMNIMIKDLDRLGVWMDHENAYQSIKPVFIEGVWFLVKKAYEKGRLYEGERTMTWCASCATAIAKHELDYQTVTENSIFLKFPIKGKKGEFLVIWTTTPWTIAFNLGIMVNPELDYVKCQVDDEKWIVAKALAGPFIQMVVGKDLKILEEMKGEKLEGIEYEHPWHKDIKVYAELKKKHPKVHTVLLSEEYVDTSAGSGLVHMAPGCGPEDYEVGHKNNVPPYNAIDEHGVFDKTTGRFAGMRAKIDDRLFIEELKKSGNLIEQTPVEHEYAHCQRCHNPVVFRTTTQWFFKVEDIKPELIKQNEQIKWVPQTAFNAFDSWLKNLRDNSVTKQRFWGTPLPVWRCDSCKKVTVIGSIAELEKTAGKKVPELHKPWIDDVVFKCPCGKEQRRIPDVLDVWVDAGTNSWTCLDYPNRKDLFEELWPAQFILEAKDQIRGWFNLMHIASNLAFGKPCFKAVYMHAWAQDALGRKMSKSLGNIIKPDDVINEYGADTLRYYFISGTPGDDFIYSPDEAKIQMKNLGVLWNLHKFLIDMCENNDLKLKDLEDKSLVKLYGEEERFIISRMHSATRHATRSFDNYQLNDVPGAADSLFLDLSRTYIQLVRDKAATGDDEDKRVVASVTYQVLMNSLKLFAPVAPFITEAIYQDLKKAFGLKEESIHHCAWPKWDDKDCDSELEAGMATAMQAVGASSFAREKANINTRWPLKTLTLVTSDKKVVESCEKLGDLIRRQANVKEIRIQESMPGIKFDVKADTGKIGSDFGKLTPKVIAAIVTHSVEDVVRHMQKDRRMVIKIDGQEVNLVPEHVFINRIVPAHLKEASFQGGLAYLDTTTTPELEAEGFSREVTRRIQALRRTAGLQRKDRVTLHIKAGKESSDPLKAWLDTIKEKCGVASLTIDDKDPAKKPEWSSEEKIKGKALTLAMHRE
ncbi:MAG: isoleucine--tRNA ligase [Nanoarchaeota archaeon]